MSGERDYTWTARSATSGKYVHKSIYITQRIFQTTQETEGTTPIRTSFHLWQHALRATGAEELPTGLSSSGALRPRL